MNHKNYNELDINSFLTMSSPLGRLTLIADTDSLVALYVGNEEKPLLKSANNNPHHPILKKAQIQLEEYFNGSRQTFNLPINPKGTPFQQKAWKALQQINYGEVWSYGQQAKYLKNPKAQRAVGGANGKNPLPIIIPCHRVVGSTGKLTGFSGGMKMKIYLLKHEGREVDPRGLTVHLNSD